jgi:hypothetical protein
MTHKRKKQQTTEDGLTHYSEFPGFQHYYLEDSWICGIVGRPGILELHITVVLNTGHPEYSPARPGEMYPFRPAVLRFRGITSQEWFDSEGNPTTGSMLRQCSFEPDGEMDRGGSIYLNRDRAGVYLLDCDLGYARIAASELPEIELVNI